MTERIREYVTAWEGNEPLVAGERIVRCRDCKHATKDGMLCRYFLAYEPIAGGDEYAELPAEVKPDGFCAWASKREGAES